MLVDDNPDDNFFHERVIRKHAAADTIVVKQSAIEALEHLKAKEDNGTNHPDLIFLDINMPAMNGWEFLEEYKKLSKEQQGRAVIIMLTTSDNPDDKMRAKMTGIACDYHTKPLTQSMLDQVIDRYC